jgi:predicted CopG family antitoxin
MGTKTIGLRDDAYERLKARKRDDESFTDLVERLLDEATADWREGFGTLEPAETEALIKAVEDARSRTSSGLANRQQQALTELAPEEDDRDETA